MRKNVTLSIFFLSCTFLIYSQQCLRNTGSPNGVLIGDLDISGNQITIEALVYRLGSGGPNIVSKHTDPSNVNYLLRPTTFELTTSNGFLLMSNPYTIQNDRWYHIAGTYDGSYVRYYVNGCLVIEQPWTGNLVTNNLQACIGNISSSPYGEGFNGYIDEVRIWNIARTEAQIKQNMTNLPSPATYTNLRAYYKFEGNYNNILGTGYNGTPLNSPSIVAVTGTLPTEFRVLDVKGTENVICNGFQTGSITVVPSVTNGTTYSVNGGSYQGSNVFSNLTGGNYDISVRSQEGCILTETVTIVDETPLRAGPDQTICSGETVQLNATGGGAEYRWDPDPTLSSTTIPDPEATPNATTTYVVRSKVRVGQNLVVNGNFEMGNTGFSSGYTSYTSGGFNQGNYVVTSNPQIYNTGFSSCGDHTSSTGLMLLADAACVSSTIPAGTDLWCQTISVSPNTDYEFSAWMANVITHQNSSTLSFSINGIEIGNPVATTNIACEWDEFFVTWNSGGATSAVICISEGTGVCSGNDFAIDDISFYELCELVDSVTVTVSPNTSASISGTTSVCLNEASPIVSFEGIAGTAPYTFTYNVNGGGSLTLTSDASGTAVVPVSTSDAGIFVYALTQVVDSESCITDIADTAIITVYASPSASVSGTASVCLDAASPVVSFEGNAGVAPYVFTYTIGGGVPQTLTSNGAGEASVPVSTTVAGTYIYELIEISDANGCIASTSEAATVIVYNLPVIVISDVSVCESEAINLTASGADTYSWSPSTNLSDTTGSSVIFTAGTTGTYTVIGVNTHSCSDTASFTVTVNSLPSVEAGADVFECEGASIALSASGTGVNYTWNNGVMNNQSFIPPVGTTVYVVTGTDLNNCSNRDSLWVNIEQIPVVSFIAVQNEYCVPVTAQFQNTTTASIQSCEWTFDNGNSVTGCGPVSQVFDQPGTYGATLRVETSGGCVSETYNSSMVIVDPYPIASFNFNPQIISMINPDVTFINTSWGATSYIWDFGDGGSSVQNSPAHTYPIEFGESFEVTLIAISENGCRDTTRSTIEVEEELIFYIPNTFTPDGNQFNQTFAPVFTSGYDPFDYTLFIFNRWGELIFESHNSSVGWDGTYNGKISQEGTYMWKIEVKTLASDERKSFAGHVNLLR